MTLQSPKIDWSDLFPWTIIFRSLSSACSISVVVFALIGVLATPMGWIASESLFINSDKIKNQNPLLAELAERNRSPYRGVFQATEMGKDNLNVLGIGLSGPRLVFEQTVRPFYAIFGGSTTTREFLYFSLGGIWSIIVWSFVGLGICRICLLRLTRNEKAGLDDAFEYATSFFKTCFSALALPMAVGLLLCIPTFFIGLLMGFDFGAMIVGLAWFIVLGIAFLLGILLLGLFASWPLVVASVAAEGQNSFDAVTRAFAYVFQRPVHYIFYATVAVIFGGIVWLVAYQFTDSVIRLSFWSTGWGANRVSTNRIDEIKGHATPFRGGFFSTDSWVSKFQDDSNLQEDSGIGAELSDAQSPETALANDEPIVFDTDPLPAGNEKRVAPVTESNAIVNARRFIYFWIAFAKTAAAAFIHGLFWCMASAVYLLLRKDVDETEMDEIYLIEEQRTYDLPPLQSDEHGIPQIQPLPMDEDENPDSEGN